MGIRRHDSHTLNQHHNGRLKSSSIISPSPQQRQGRQAESHSIQLDAPSTCGYDGSRGGSVGDLRWLLSAREKEIRCRRGKQLTGPEVVELMGGTVMVSVPVFVLLGECVKVKSEEQPPTVTSTVANKVVVAQEVTVAWLPQSVSVDEPEPDPPLEVVVVSMFVSVDEEPVAVEVEV